MHCSIFPIIIMDLEIFGIFFVLVKGLDLFCTPENFDKVGIAKVKAVTTGTGKNKTTTYEPGGTKYYVRHLDQSLYEKQLFDEFITKIFK